MLALETKEIIPLKAKTIAIQSPGDMGHAIGRDLIARGFRVVTCLAGRSERSIGLARAGGLEVLDDLDTLVSEAALVLSIVPPSVAESVAKSVFEAMERTNQFPTYADCNAIAPRTVQQIARIFEGSACPFVDAGIIGLAPGKSDQPTRFYCAGPDTSAMEALDGGGMSVTTLSTSIGDASAMKMIYAAVTKGTMTLHAMALTAAKLHGLSDAYAAEAAASQANAWAAMNRMVPRLPLDAGRWVGEMHEIAAFFADSGLPEDFHLGAAKMFELLDKTPIAAETRETVDESRTLDQALQMYADVTIAERESP